MNCTNFILNSARKISKCCEDYIYITTLHVCIFLETLGEGLTLFSLKVRMERIGKEMNIFRYLSYVMLYYPISYLT